MMSWTWSGLSLVLDLHAPVSTSFLDSSGPGPTEGRPKQKPGCDISNTSANSTNGREGGVPAQLLSGWFPCSTTGNETTNGTTLMESQSPYFVRELECKGKAICIKQLYVGDVGCVVWDAAIVLCKFLENGEFFPPNYWKGKRVVDVGSGTGVAGLAAAVMGLAHVPPPQSQLKI